MSVELSVEERARLVMENTKPPELDNHKSNQLSNVLYTLSEAGIILTPSTYDACIAWSVVNMILAEKYNDEMRL